MAISTLVKDLHGRLAARLFFRDGCPWVSAPPSSVQSRDRPAGQTGFRGRKSLTELLRCGIEPAPSASISASDPCAGLIWRSASLPLRVCVPRSLSARVSQRPTAA
jgi:hypothetical protein